MGKRKEGSSKFSRDSGESWKLLGLSASPREECKRNKQNREIREREKYESETSSMNLKGASIKMFFMNK